MSARNLGRERTESRSAPEVSTIPRQVDLRVHDRVALDEIELYADEDNGPAIRMYEALGFTRTRTDAMYRRPPRRPRGDDPPAPPGG